MTSAGALGRMSCLLMTCKRSGVRIPIAPQVRIIIRTARKLSTAVKYSSAAASAVARRFGYGLPAEHGVDPCSGGMRLTGSLTSRNTSRLSERTSKVLRNGAPMAGVGVTH
jgi:hypothetical protein